jgi:PAS domain S-box-containing protein
LEYRSWPVILTALLSMGVTLMVWQAVRISERAHIHRMARLAASAVREDLVADTQSWISGLVQLAKLWESPDGPTHSEWKSNAELYIQHHPGCVAVEWVQPSFEERWVVRSPGEILSPPVDESRAQLLRRAEASAGPVLGHAHFSSDNTLRRAMVVPIFRNRQFEGFVIAIVDINRSYGSMLGDVASLGYSIAIREQDKEIYRLQGSTSENEEQWTQHYDVRLAGITQRLNVWPKPDVLREMSSRLPAATLLFGTLLCVLLTFTVYLAQKAGTRSVRLHQANLQLQEAIDEQQRIATALRSSQTRLAGILEISADAVISVDETFHITLFNQGAERMFGYRQHEVLGQPLDLLVPERFRDIHHTHTANFANSGQTTLLMAQRQAVFGRRRDGTEFPIEASLAKLKLQEGTVFTAIVRDITERVRSQEELQRSHEELETRVLERTAELQELSNRIVHLQDEERRRLARELHDGTTQTLIAIGMDVSTLTKMLSEAEPRVQTKLAECKDLVSQCMNEIRTVSYLLHPPLLDELGIDLAMRNYVEGFSRRSGIHINLVLPDLQPLSREVELAIFRIVQESLANIHRHSGSQTAAIILGRQNGKVMLEISDQGCGIPPELLNGGNGSRRSGVGLAGIRERIRQLKGACEIESNSAGTKIRISLPAVTVEGQSIA